MTSRRFACAVLLSATSSVGCEQGTPQTPAATATATATAKPAPSPAPIASTSTAWRPQLPPIVLPEWAKRPAEPDSDPRVLADTQGVCGQMTRQRFSSFGQMATLTKRWARLQWLFAQGEPGAACEIEKLVRDAARYPQSDCKPLIEYFARACKSYSPRELR